MHAANSIALYFLLLRLFRVTLAGDDAPGRVLTSLKRLDTFSSTLKLWDDAEKLVRDKTSLFGIELIYYNRGTELGQIKRYDEAIADFSKAIAKFPFDYVYGNRATAYYLL